MKPAFTTSIAPGGIAGKEIGSLNCASNSPGLSSSPAANGSSGEGYDPGEKWCAASSNAPVAPLQLEHWFCEAHRWRRQEDAKQGEHSGMDVHTGATPSACVPLLGNSRRTRKSPSSSLCIKRQPQMEFLKAVAESLFTYSDAEYITRQDVFEFRRAAAK